MVTGTALVLTDTAMWVTCTATGVTGSESVVTDTAIVVTGTARGVTCTAIGVTGSEIVVTWTATSVKGTATGMTGTVTRGDKLGNIGDMDSYSVATSAEINVKSITSKQLYSKSSKSPFISASSSPSQLIFFDDRGTRIYGHRSFQGHFVFPKCKLFRARWYLSS